jgi:hypothetical protein
MRFSFLLLLPILFSPSFARAQACGSLSAGQDCVAASATKSITAFSTCAKITNNHASGKAILIPIKTSPEWSAFRSHPPAGVSVGTCTPLTIDASATRITPNYVSNGVAMTSASFTPPNNSLIVVCVGTDSGANATNDATLTVSDSGLHTWTKVQERDPNSGATDGDGSHSSLWYAKITTGSSMTISMTPTSNTLGAATSTFKWYIFTNYDTSSPIGASNSGSVAGNPATASTALTSTTADSILVGCASAWGTGTGSSTTGTADGFNGLGDFSGVTTYFSAPSVGTVMNLNLKTSGTPTGQWHWTALEVKPSP